MCGSQVRPNLFRGYFFECIFIFPPLKGRDEEKGGVTLEATKFRICCSYPPISLVFVKGRVGGCFGISELNMDDAGGKGEDEWVAFWVLVEPFLLYFYPQVADQVFFINEVGADFFLGSVESFEETNCI